MASNISPVKKAILDNIVVIEELQEFIPALSKHEREQLKDSIKAEGVKEAITLWLRVGESGKDEYVIVDGHNRYFICKEIGIDNFPTRTMSFEDEDEAKVWMLKHQTSRRNLKPITFQYLIGKMYNSFCTRQGGKTSEKDNISKTLSVQFGISERSVFNYAKTSEKLDTLSSGQRHQIFTAKEKVTNKDIEEMYRRILSHEKADKMPPPSVNEKQPDELRLKIKRLATVISENSEEKETYATLTRKWIQEGLEKYLQMNPNIDLDVVE